MRVPASQRNQNPATLRARSSFFVVLAIACLAVVFLGAQTLASIGKRGRFPSSSRLREKQTPEAAAREAEAESESAATPAAADSQCVHRSSSSPSSPPLFEYCRCKEGQRGDFSSARVEERWRHSFGESTPGSRALRGLQNPRSQGANWEGMKLLMLAMEREQLTKGRMHLAESMHLARALNRTLVLTRVGDSRIGFDRSLHLCTYFDTVKLGQFVDWVSDEVALHVLQPHLRQGVPARKADDQGSGSRLSVLPLMLIKRGQSCDHSLWSELEPKVTSEKHPLAVFLRERLASGQLVCVRERGTRETRIATAQLMHAVGEERVEAADVLLVFKVGDLMYFEPHVMKDAEDHVVFAPHLEDATHGMVRYSLKEDEGKAVEHNPASASHPLYVAIQWRTEYALLQSRMDHSRMMRCVDGMLQLVTAKLKELHSSTVFLAADISIDGQASSSTFHMLPKHLQDAAREAIQKVYAELRPKSWSAVEPLFTSLDNGIQGILDKLMCLQAPLFIFAPRACGGRSSSFTRAIIGARKSTRGKWPYMEWHLT